MRLEKDDYFLHIAKLVSMRATCVRRQVGCVIVDEHNHILATGYNGVPMNYRHCTDVKCAGADMPSGTGLNACMATHAEQNALLQCKNIFEINTIYCTTSPCPTCAKLIANTSCKRVVYSEMYSDTSNLKLFDELGIKHEYIKTSLKVTLLPNFDYGRY
jgi:dCMP deaminase